MAGPRKDRHRRPAFHFLGGGKSRRRRGGAPRFPRSDGNQRKHGCHPGAKSGAKRQGRRKKGDPERASASPRPVARFGRSRRRRGATQPAPGKSIIRESPAPCHPMAAAGLRHRPGTGGLHGHGSRIQSAGSAAKARRLMRFGPFLPRRRSPARLQRGSGGWSVAPARPAWSSARRCCSSGPGRTGPC